jgi:CheY-like chemotaxis protein
MTKILVVEDDAASRDVMARRLQRYGFNLIVAQDGPSGIRAATEHRPDLILMDLALGEIMDGLQAAQAIRSSPETKYIPIIAITAFIHDFDREACLRAGCSDFESQPVDMPRLLRKIRACLSQ